MNCTNHKNLTFRNRLSFARQGLLAAWQSEKSFRTQAKIGAAALLSATFLGCSTFEFALILLCAALVLAAELCNTALETLVDLLHPQLDPQVKKIKDIAAGMVLIISLGAACVGLLILVNHL